MSVLILISDFDSYREICISACYHTFARSRLRDLLDTCLRQLDLEPSRAELYLSEATDTRLTSVMTAAGIQLQTTAAGSRTGDLAPMYEAKARVSFAQLQVLLGRYGRLAYSFDKLEALQA